MVSFTIASFVFSTLVASESAQDPFAEQRKAYPRVVQNEIIIDGKRIDPVITGQTNADTVADWERRLKDSQNCETCETVNPVPADLED